MCSRDDDFLGRERPFWRRKAVEEGDNLGGVCFLKPNVDVLMACKKFDFWIGENIVNQRYPGYLQSLSTAICYYIRNSRC